MASPLKDQSRNMSPAHVRSKGWFFEKISGPSEA